MTNEEQYKKYLKYVLKNYDKIIDNCGLFPGSILVFI